ncbi:class II fructose-bisphosphate aldolase [Candidatus Berkelbacteria bacterium]|nr:class II fructose-bisphosphate aldolase [Candidatus Berkelbacteria bacterium]
MLNNSQKILKEARRQHYAVGQFNVFNLETARAVIKAAEKLKAPVIIGVSPKTIEYAGLNQITSIIKTEASGTKNPVVLHLDHSFDFGLIKKAVSAGFTSVMFDGSKVNLAENLKITQKTVNLCRPKNISVEAEIGVIGGKLTEPEEAAIFAQKTKANSLAISIGNVHGGQFAAEKLDLKLLQNIAQSVKIPLVLHGASSAPRHEIKRAIKFGIVKINIDTDLRTAFRKGILKYAAREKDPRIILGNTTREIQRVVEEKIKLFGSQNHA